MSDQLYTQEQIVHHVENASPTKFMYSFSKAERFPTIKRTGKSDTFYNLPSTIMRRTAGFGFGQKSDFTKARHVPTEFISIKRDFDDKNSQPGFKYSFGLSRDKFAKTVCPGYKNIDKNKTIVERIRKPCFIYGICLKFSANLVGFPELQHVKDILPLLLLR